MLDTGDFIKANEIKQLKCKIESIMICPIFLKWNKLMSSCHKISASEMVIKLNVKNEMSYELQETCWESANAWNMIVID